MYTSLQVLVRVFCQDSIECDTALYGLYCSITKIQLSKVKDQIALLNDL